jgi:hypothetical protein
MADVNNWAWIVSAQSVDEMAERFLSTGSNNPTFLLLEILRRDILQVRTLKLLLCYTWNQLVGTPRSNLTTISETELNAIVVPPSEAPRSHLNPSSRPPTLEDSTFIMIISRLLRQARRIWAPAVVNISHMAGLIIHLILHSNNCDPRQLDPRMHHRLCRIYNHTLRLLALPASIDPLKSMSYNWRAQTVLLEAVGHLNPPLTLDQDSYRAVVQVLAASKKSERESRVANLRTRSWPPWRIDQDGMDAQRSLEDDLSRVVSATMRTKESGYTESVKDQAFRILGGQEPDGTPTIQTRKLIKRRPRPAERKAHSDVEPDLWAARIEATRDIQEAWSAFKGFEEQGGQPSSRMYLAMFEKLDFDKARSGKKAQYDASPGDGKEVFTPLTDNVSTFYRQRLLPPSFDELYDKMIQSGSRPTGRLLTFLLGHARTVGKGLQYLRDSQVNQRAVAFLSGDKEISPAILEKLPASTFAAFIMLLCRFAPRAVCTETSPSKSDEADEHDENAELAQIGSEYQILEPKRHSGGPQLNPLLHTMELLKESRTHFRPAWYALFAALARRGVIIDRGLVGDPRNDLLSWQVLVAALGDFHRCGLELDPRGFQIICHGLEKAVLASFDVTLAEKVAAFAQYPVTVVVDEFMKMSEAEEMDPPYRIPKLLHSIGGEHLHAYVRVLGLIEDYEGIKYLLKWMRTHHEALEEIAIQSRNGPKLIRRVFIAMRVFLSGTVYEAEAERLIESVEKWDGWPQEFEAQKYLERWTGKPRSEDDSEETA